MSEFTYMENTLNDKILNIRTAYLGKVKAVNGNMATVQPLTQYQAAKGEANTQSVVSAVIPSNIKQTTKDITYRVSDDTSKTTTVCVPSELAVGDIVYVGICDRDITNAKRGVISTPTKGRHHNINDGVILRVL